MPDMEKRAIMFSTLGDKEAKEWLLGYGDRIIGKTSDDYSMQGIRGWLWADEMEERRKFDMRMARYERQTQYIFGCPHCGVCG